MVHVEAVDDLVVLAVAGRSDVNDFPVQGAGEFSEALEGDVELERGQNIGRVVPYSDIVYMQLCHSKFSRLLQSIIYILKTCIPSVKFYPTHSLPNFRL